MDDREVFPPFNHPGIVLATQSIHLSSFLVPPPLLRKSREEISFEGGGL
jgi:hypothetical protein